MNESTIKAIQAVLFPNNPEEVDGKWGPKSQAAFDAIVHPTKLIGDGTWTWIQMSKDGEDLVIEPGIVTAFGGDSDSMDSGETASGISTRDNPSYIGCALPMRRDSSPSLRGSPIPNLPWKTTVIFSDDHGVSVNTKLIDEGPARWTKHIGDLTVAAAQLFDRNASANNFERVLGIRIVGGAKYL